MMPGLVTALDSRNGEQIHHRNRQQQDRNRRHLPTLDGMRQHTAEQPGPDRWTATTPTRKHPPAPRRRASDRRQRDHLRRDSSRTETEGKDTSMTTQDSTTSTTSTTSTSTTPPTSDSMPATPAETGQRKRRKNTTSTQARNAYNNRAYDRIEIRIPKGQREQLQAAAAAAGLSTAAYIIRAINAAAGADIITPLATNPYI